MSELEERMRLLEVKQAVADSAIMHLTDQQTRHHNEVMGRLDEIQKALSERPCSVHEEKLNNFGNHLIGMWSIISLTTLAVIGFGVRSIFEK